MEDQTRGPAAQALRQTAEYYLSFARNDSSQYAHITPAERETVAKEAQSALTWLGEGGGSSGFRVWGVSGPRKQGVGLAHRLALPGLR